MDIQAKVLETLEPVCDRSNGNEHSSSTTAPKTSKIKSLDCPICAAPHFVYKCPLYASASMSEKLQKVKDLKFCYNCLSNSHLKPDCPSKIRCQEPNCRASHHTSLHTQLRKDFRNVNEKNLSTYKKSVSSKSDLQNNDHDAETSTQFQRSQNQKSSRQPQFNAAAIDKFPKDLFSVLQIIPVSIINGDKTFDTYALIDPGSTGTYIVDHISSFLSLETGKEYKLDVQFLSLSRSLSVSATSFDIAPYADNDNKFHVQHAFSTPNINPPPADTTELNDICQNFPQLSHIKIPDINKGKIGVLRGTSCVPFVHSLEWIRGAHNCPSGIRTELGWTIAGEFRHSSRKKSTATKHLLFFASHETSPQSASTDILEHYWNVEKIATEPAQKDASSTHDKEALQIPQVTCRHNGERYEIGLSWKRDTPLPNNYFAALSQLRSLEKQFREHPQKKAKFDETLQKDLEKGYVKQVKMQHPRPREFGTSPRIPSRLPMNLAKSAE